MIYLLLAWEFFKIGLFAIGGGMVTIPFLFDLSEKYVWFTKQELADMIAISQSTPGPMGINMATYTGYNTAGILGALIATLSEVLPSMIIIYWIARMLEKFRGYSVLHQLLQGIRPAVLALILYAGWDVARLALTDAQSMILFVILLFFMQTVRISPIWYIAASAVVGIVFQM